MYFSLDNKAFLLHNKENTTYAYSEREALMLYTIFTSAVFDVFVAVAVIAALIYAYKTTRNKRDGECPYGCCCTCEECLTKCDKWAKEHKDKFKA